MSDLTIFDYQGKQVRTVLVEQQPWFVASDVYGVLDIAWRGVDSLIAIPEPWRTKLFAIGISVSVEIPSDLQADTWLINEKGEEPKHLNKTKTPVYSGVDVKYLIDAIKIVLGLV